MKKISKKRIWLLGAIALTAIILFTVAFAPSNNILNSGSTYSRAPDGYGAWYAFMSERGTPISRWEKPFNSLLDNSEIESPTTFLQVYSIFLEIFLSPDETNWVESGNNLVILGAEKPVTGAEFSTSHETESGEVKIETRRRAKDEISEIIGDEFGAILWEETMGKGKVIYAVTPHLAANAYQDMEGNYAFLAQIVSPNGEPVLVDEYLHGYKDTEVIAEEVGEDVISYLAKTPIFPLLVQGLIILIILIYAQNRRLGKPISLSAPVADNSQAYIEALGGVLQKAETSEFVLEVIGKEEQIQLQKALGLGERPIEDRALIDAWVQQTGRSPQELEAVLKIQSRKRRITETEMLNWLEKWQQVRRQISS